MLVNTIMDIHPASWEAWKNDPVTREVMKALRVELAEWETPLREGDTLLHPGREVVQTAKAVGVIYGLDCILIGVEEALRMQWEEAKKARLEEEVEDGG